MSILNFIVYHRTYLPLLHLYCSPVQTIIPFIFHVNGWLVIFYTLSYLHIKMIAFLHKKIHVFKIEKLIFWRAQRLNVIDYAHALLYRKAVNFFIDSHPNGGLFFAVNICFMVSGSLVWRSVWTAPYMWKYSVYWFKSGSYFNNEEAACV